MGISVMGCSPTSKVQQGVNGMQLAQVKCPSSGGQLIENVAHQEREKGNQTLASAEGRRVIRCYSPQVDALEVK